MKLYQTLGILSICKLKIDTAWKVYQKGDDIFKTLPQFEPILRDQIILGYVCFMEEFNKQFIPGKDEVSERIRFVRKLAKPIIKRINKWYHLREYRDNFIAHANRKNGEFVLYDPAVYTIPRNEFEVFQLVLFVDYIAQIITREFAPELKETHAYLADKEPSYLPPSDYSNINSDLLAMANEVNELYRQNNKSYSLKVMGFILPNEE